MTIVDLKSTIIKTEEPKPYGSNEVYYRFSILPYTTYILKQSNQGLYGRKFPYCVHFEDTEEPYKTLRQAMTRILELV